MFIITILIKIQTVYDRKYVKHAYYEYVVVTNACIFLSYYLILKKYTIKSNIIFTVQYTQ